MKGKQLHGKDEELIKYITGIIEKSCNMREVDAVYKHCEYLLYEDSCMDSYLNDLTPNEMENYGARSE